MHMLVQSLLLGGVAALAVGTQTFAQDTCVLKDVQVQSDRVVIAYDPFDRFPDRSPVPLRVISSGCENTRLELVVVPEIESLSAGGGLKAVSGGAALELDLTLDGVPAQSAASAVTAFDTASATGRLSGNSGQFSGPGLEVSLPYGADVAPGRYRARATLLTRTVSSDGSVSAPVRAPFEVEIDVQPSFRLAAGAERAKLWLGELATGQRSQSMTFLAFSNTGYALKIRSEHSGRMTLAGSTRADAAAVPYALEISGADVNWVDGRGEQSYSRPRLVRTHDVVAVTGEVDPNRPAGDYTDWVTVEIVPVIS